MVKLTFAHRKVVKILCVALLVPFVLRPFSAAAEEQMVDLAPEARAAILMDMDTGTVLFEKNSDQRLPPASITKIMTMLLVMEAIDEGKISWTDKVRTSERAASMGGSQIFLEVGEEMTVEELMKGVAIASGNDATVALAEYVAGTEDNFVRMMNEKAQELGLENTSFVNTNGLPAPDHYSSARDIAIMSRELIKHEKILDYTSIYEDYLRKDTDRPFWLVNTNRLVKHYEGVDGLKTGYTHESLYCLSATAKRENMRVIAVVMGAPKPKMRNQYISNMLNYAFNQFETHPVFQQGDVLEKVKVDKGEQSQIEMVAPHQISVLTKKSEDLSQYQTTIEPIEGLQAPVKAGDVIGYVRITNEGRTEVEVEIVALEDIPKASFLKLFTRTSRYLFGLFP